MPSTSGAEIVCPSGRLSLPDSGGFPVEVDSMPDSLAVGDHPLSLMLGYSLLHQSTFVSLSTLQILLSS